jgi:ribonuclease Z
VELIFLGTGAGMPAKSRNVTSIALDLSAERGTTWLFDCGEATQHQILHTSIRPRRIEKIFITHLHGDHIFGLPGLLSSRSFQDGETDVTLYGPKGIKQFVEVSLQMSQTYLKYHLEIVEMEEEGCLFEDGDFKVEVKRLEHGILSYGFRVVEKDLPGELLVEKLKAIGIEPGPLYKQIKTSEFVELPNGETLDCQQFLGPKKPGRVVTILGDTRFHPAAVALAAHADVLVHEATFAKDEESLAYNYYHSTTFQAANVAYEAEVQQLILTHISSRYQTEEDYKELLEEARSVFPAVALAKDFWSYKIPRKTAEDHSI